MQTSRTTGRSGPEGGGGADRAAAAPTRTRTGRLLAERLAEAPPPPRGLQRRVALVAADDPQDAWTLTFERGRASLAEGVPEEPDLTLTADAAVHEAVLAADASPWEEALAERLRPVGDLSMALRLPTLLGLRRPDVGTARDVDVDGVRTFVLDVGEGPVVTLLHGLGGNAYSMLPLVVDLARDHRVLAVDLPGFGASAKPLRPLHAAYQAEQLVGLLDALGVERSALVGNSMGGRVALETGLRSPDRVTGLVLLCPSMAWQRGRDWDWLVRLLRAEAALLPGLGFPRRRVERTVRAMYSRPRSAPGAWVDAAVADFQRRFSRPKGRVAFFSALRQIYLEDPFEGRGRLWARLPELAVPALFVWGDRDRLVPARFGRKVEEVLPAARSVVLEDTGHVPQLERPERTAQVVRELLAEAED